MIPKKRLPPAAGRSQTALRVDAVV
jgi:hypothetical protein